MGRTRTKSKKSRPVAVEPSGAEPSNKTAPSIPSLLEKAQSLIVQCDYDLARLFTQRILEHEPKHAEAKEMLGVVQLETGELDAAKQVSSYLQTYTGHDKLPLLQTFLTLLPPNPDAPSPPPASAHLYLAQLSDDDPQSALRHYQSAIDILMVQLKGKERAVNSNASDEDETELKGNIVRALIGQVEIWMDPSYDLCFDPAAEKNCEELLNLALQTDPGNPEALQALGSVRMSQQRPDEAKECLEKAWTAWKDLEPDDPKLPPIPTRLAMVKLFLELSLFAPALLVLVGVLAVDDQEVEAWYLEGWCFFLMTEQAKETGGTVDDLPWPELGRDARDCLETCQVLHTNEGHPDLPLLEHVRELITKLESLGISSSSSEPENEAEDNDEEWEDEGESDDEDVEMA